MRYYPCLTLKGELPLKSLLEGERPEFYSLPMPNGYFIVLDSDPDRGLKWNAHWRNRSVCEQVRKRTLGNLRHLKTIQKIYKSVQEQDDNTFPDSDLEYLIGKVDARISKWNGIIKEVRGQLNDQGDIQILGT